MIRCDRRAAWRIPLFLTVVLVFLVGSGCASLNRWRPQGWVADYDTAEVRVRETGRELLIYYRDTRPGVEDPTAAALKDGRVKQRTRDYVRCSLFKPYEPDRRYVAQFGVDRAPALIVVHRDGTYHARTGLFSAVDIAQFLDDAHGSGAQPVLNPYIPRRVEYGWHHSPESAYGAAERTEGAILFVFYRWLSRDWHKMKKLLHRPEVHPRLADMVHCRLSSLRRAARDEAERFEVARWPALVIAHQDGTYHVLELPTSYVQIVRFADKHRLPNGKVGEQSATAAAGP